MNVFQHLEPFTNTLCALCKHLKFSLSDRIGKVWNEFENVGESHKIFITITYFI